MFSWIFDTFLWSMALVMFTLVVGSGIVVAVLEGWPCLLYKEKHDGEHLDP